MGEAQDKTDLQHPYYRLGLPKQGLPEDKFPGGFCKSAVTAQFYYQMEQNKKKKDFTKNESTYTFFFLLSLTKLCKYSLLLRQDYIKNY